MSPLQLTRKIWSRLPVDGSGVIPGGTRRQRLFQDVAARGFWGRVPAWYRVPALIAARLLWLAACPVRVLRESRNPFARFCDLPSALWCGWVLGKPPSATILHRALARGANTSLDYASQIPGDRQGILLLAALGRRDEIVLATDKLEIADRLAKLGIPVPSTRTVISRGLSPDIGTPPWTGTEKLLAKPRHGSHAQGLSTITCLGAGFFSIKGGPPVTRAQLSQKLTAAARRDSLLVQSYIAPSPDTRDLSPDAPVVIRAFVTRQGPHQDVSVVSAMLKILPPGMDAPVGIDELLLVPIDVGHGTLADGLLLDRPGDRWPRTPWTGAPLRGRPVPDWRDIADIVARASAVLPGIPVIGWDVLLGPEGPVILEANTGVSLFRAMLWHIDSGLPSPVPATLEAWCRTR
jgi:hypothetical protein